MLGLGKANARRTARRVARRPARRCRGRATPGTTRRRTGATRVALLEEQASTRIPELVPIRYGRMLVSPSRSSAVRSCR